MIDTASPEFDELLEQAVHAVHEHVQEEGTQVLPVLAKVAPKDLLADLGHAFSEAKAEVLRNPSAVTPETLEQTAKPKGRHAKTTKTTKTKAGGPGEELSKEELYERAKEADIPGRSHMSKDELAKALQKAGR